MKKRLVKKPTPRPTPLDKGTSFFKSTGESETKNEVFGWIKKQLKQIAIAVIVWSPFFMALTHVIHLTITDWRYWTITLTALWAAILSENLN